MFLIEELEDVLTFLAPNLQRFKMTFLAFLALLWS